MRDPFLSLVVLGGRGTAPTAATPLGLDGARPRRPPHQNY